MASKSKKLKKNRCKANTEVRVRKWTEKELKQFAYVLADEIDDFAYKLESLALKKSANEHLFRKIKEEFDARLRRTSNDNQERREEMVNNTPIDTSIVKLRNKYKWLKDQWRKITDRAKTGSGKAAKDDPEWYTILDPVFSETHTKLKLASEANDIASSVGDSSNDESVECESSIEEQTLQEKLGPSASIEPEMTNTERVKKYTISEDDDSSVQADTSDSTGKINKVKSQSCLMAPRKRKKVTTQAEALSQLSTSLVNLGESQKGRMEMWLMAEQKREEAYLKYQERQSELNRQHELRMVQLIAGLQNSRENSQTPNLVPTMHTNLPIGMHTQLPTQDIQHQNGEHNGWSVINEQAFSTISYHPPQMSTGIGDSNEGRVYTNLE